MNRTERTELKMRGRRGEEKDSIFYERTKGTRMRVD
jgi:hypothetical protein